MFVILIVFTASFPAASFAYAVYVPFADAVKFAPRVVPLDAKYAAT